MRWRGVVMGALFIGLAILLLAGVGTSDIASREPAAPGVSGPAPTPDPAPIPDPAPAPEPDPVPEVLVPYDGPVEHIFFHPLIVYPELAFDGDGLSGGYDDWFVTVKEFNRIIDSLYQNDFILVDYGTLFAEGADGSLKRRPLALPPGKKPLILSIDDLNYYQYMRENGNAYKLIVDDDGQIKTYSETPAGEPVISAENEIVPIVDEFVRRHPDFSFHGAKGVIALTGYEGILGYRTNDPAAPGYAQDVNDALTVANRLKATGWTFASHGWGHLDAVKISAETLARDTRRWKEEVEPLIGPTPVYIYPFGAAPARGEAKLKILRDLGFRILAGVGPSPHLDLQDGYVLTERRHIDGFAFREQRNQLLPFFDADAIIDPIRPGR